MMSGWLHRFTVLSRILAGFGGGYVLTSLAMVLASLSLPGSKASAVLVATMPGFLIYALIVMAVFHARDMVRTWIWIGVVAGFLAIAVLLLENRVTG